MTNQRKWLILGGLLVAWGGLTVFQMWGSTQTDPMTPSATSGTPLPALKDLELDKTFSNPRQTAKFSTPRNIFAPPGMQQMLAQQETKMASTARPIEITPPTHHGSPRCAGRPPSRTPRAHHQHDEQ